MTNTFPQITLLFTLLFVNTAISQMKYNDLYFAELKGKVETVSTMTEYFDTTNFYYGNDKRLVSQYNQNGNYILELEYLDTIMIQKRVYVYEKFMDTEKRVRKITTHSADTTNKTISYYYFDETGFDTSIVVCDLDSSYHMLYRYEKNENGLRTKGTEFNAKNGHKNYSFELYYSKNALIDSIIYRTSLGEINHTDYFHYDSKGEVTKICYSNGDCTLYVYKNYDKHGNWMEKETFSVKNGVNQLINRQSRNIQYND